MKAAPRFDPTPHCAHRGLYVFGQIAGRELQTRPAGKHSRHRADLNRLLDLSQTPQAFTKQLLAAVRLPSAAEAWVALDEGLGVSAVLPERNELVWLASPGWPDDPLRVGGGVDEGEER